MRNYIHNVILIISKSNKCLSDCPSEIEDMMVDGRTVFDYVVDACKNSKNVDCMVIVCAEDNREYFENRYHIETVTGDISDGEKYVNREFDCKKLITVSSDCPLISGNQIDYYFTKLDTCSYISTWSDENGECFPKGKKFTDEDIKVNMVSKDYPYSFVVDSPDKIGEFERRYNEYIVKPRLLKTVGTVEYYLSADGTKGISEWIKYTSEKILELKEKYELTSYYINSQTEGNIVYEACSKKFGDIIIKFTPSEKKFHKEWVYYYNAAPGIMADMIDYDTKNHILVLKMIRPGIQVKWSPDNKSLREFFDLVSENMIPVEKLGNDSLVPSVFGEFEDYKRWAEPNKYEFDFRKSIEKKAYKVWDRYFKDQPMYYLHRDFHKRNILSCEDGKVIAIDPMGAVGPKAFEYVIAFIIELREYPDDLNVSLYDSMIKYFTKYVSKEELEAAMFFFWIFKMNDYCFQKNDGNKLASWCKKCIMKIYFDDISDPTDDDLMPKGLSKLNENSNF